MTAAFASGQRTENRAEQLESLRRQMASVAGGTAGGTAGRTVVPGAPAARADDLLPGQESRLPLPQWLADALPAPLPRGSVAVLTGARSLLLGMVAAVTAAGGNAVIVGQPDIGLLAVAEMGADLSRLAVIPDPGADPVEVAAVLVDGMDLVVLGLGGRKIPPTRARAVVARARTRGCTLLVTDGDWHGAPTRLEARVCGYEITPARRDKPAPGCGRISRVRLEVGGLCAGRTVPRARAG